MDKLTQQAIDALNENLQSMNNKMDLIVQKLKTLEKNEEIIGKTLVAHNEKMKKLEEKVASGAGQAGSGASSEELNSLKRDVEQLRKDLTELKYVIQQVNPLEYATISQVKELIKGK